MPLQNRFLPGTVVKITKGAFTNSIGVVLDPQRAVDQRGKLFPQPAKGYHWVMLTLNNNPFPAHMSEDDLELITPEDGASET